MMITIVTNIVDQAEWVDRAYTFYSTLTAQEWTERAVRSEWATFELPSGEQVVIRTEHIKYVTGVNEDPS